MLPEIIDTILDLGIFGMEFWKVEHKLFRGFETYETTKKIPDGSFTVVKHKVPIYQVTTNLEMNNSLTPVTNYLKQFGVVSVTLKDHSLYEKERITVQRLAKLCQLELVCKTWRRAVLVFKKRNSYRLKTQTEIEFNL